MHREPARCYPGTLRAVRSTTRLLLAAVLCASLPSPAHAAEEEPAAVRAEMLYSRIPPDILVNLRGSGGHYLMVTAEIQTSRQADIDNALYHAAAIRHHMLMSMGEVAYRDALSPEGRVRLGEQSLAIVRRVLDEETGDNDVRAVLFSSYLVE